MWDNIGSRVKTLAQVIFVIETIVSVIGTLIAFVMFLDDDTWVYALFSPIGGAISILLSWVSSWVIYAIGEAADFASSLEYYTYKTKNASNVYSKVLKEIADGNNPQSAGQAPAVAPNQWLCPSCGQINMKYVGTCGCGTPRPASAAPKAPTPSPKAPAPQPEPKPAPTLKADEWYCPECGLVHKSYVGSCGCGRQKP